ncbi:MAG: hypothetical protein GEU73_17770, partial [Chloroflexi bacterium]|nr:hypothetical protein [Chloroflexota bacterium]
MLTLTRSQLDEIVRHALAEPTREVCGILGGRDGRVHRVYRGRNVADTPETRYSMDPHDILAITEAIASDGLDLVGI